MKIEIYRANKIRKFRQFRKTLTCEKGSVESALTLIPLMILFLTVLQLTMGVYGRITGDQLIQGNVARQAMGIMGGDTYISGLVSQGQNNSANPNSSSSTQETIPIVAIPLPGGGSLDVGTLSTTLPSVSPLLPNGDTHSSSGLAVQE